MVTTLEQDIIYQYLDGWDLLSSTLVERRQLLHVLEQLAKDPQGTTNTGYVAGFPLVSAQAILFELSIIGENIDTLIGEINSYAERCGKPRVEIIEASPNDLP